MKKTIALFLMIIVFFMTSCESDSSGGITDVFSPKSEFEKALIHFEESDNYRMDILMSNVPIFGSVSSYVLMEDGNSYQNVMSFESYTVMVDGEMYELVENDDSYVAVKGIEDEEESGDVDTEFLHEFKEEDFTKNEDGYYVSSINYDDLSSVKIKIESDHIVEILAKMDADGIVIDLTITFSGIGTTTFDLPQYTVLRGMEGITFLLEEAGFTVSESDTAVTLNKYNVDYVYSFDTDYFTFTDLYGEVSYYPESEMIEVDSELISVSDYTEDSFYLVEEDFLLMNAIYDLMNE